MKKSLQLFALICLFCGYLNAQSYHKLVSIETAWTEIVQDTIADTAGVFPYYSQQVFFTGVDTLMSHYNCTSLHQIDYTFDSIAEFNEFNRVGYLFEPDKRVFFLNVNHCSGAINSMLLYDFSLQPGDSIIYTRDTANLMYFDKFLVLSSIDSVVVDNSFRKQFHFFNSNERWIEGIGSIHGLLHPIQGSFECACKPFLVCYKFQQNTKYLNPLFNTCLPGISAADVAKIDMKKSIKIYPNPIRNNSIIQWVSQNRIMANYEIFNSAGSVVLSGRTTENSINISKNNFPQGLYFVQIHSGTFVFSEKFMIQ